MYTFKQFLLSEANDKAKKKKPATDKKKPAKNKSKNKECGFISNKEATHGGMSYYSLGEL